MGNGNRHRRARTVMHHNQRARRGTVSISTPSTWGTTPFGQTQIKRDKEREEWERERGRVRSRGEGGPCWQSKQVRLGQPHEIWSMGYCLAGLCVWVGGKREIVARSCCDCPQNGTINVAYPFSQIVAQQKDAMPGGYTIVEHSK